MYKKWSNIRVKRSKDLEGIKDTAERVELVCGLIVITAFLGDFEGVFCVTISPD